MPFAIRLVVALILVAVAAFCAFGFLATFEPPGYPVLRLAYATLRVVCLLGAGWLVIPRRLNPSYAIQSMGCPCRAVNS
jgi:peptidoglycan/LPS O-acetylase OafA/YrhL